MVFRIDLKKGIQRKETTEKKPKLHLIEAGGYETQNIVPL